MAGWYHQLNGHEFEQTPKDSDGQGSLVCYSPWGGKESDVTQRLKNNNRPHTKHTELAPAFQQDSQEVQMHVKDWAASLSYHLLSEWDPTEP